MVMIPIGLLSAESQRRVTYLLTTALGLVRSHEGAVVLCCGLCARSLDRDIATMPE